MTLSIERSRDLELPGTLTETAYALPPGLTYGEWATIGTKLQRAHRAIQWWAGDWLNYGSHAYGEKYAQAIKEFPYAYQSLKNAAFVSSRLEPYRRRYELSWSHHQEVANLEPDEADALLRAAIDHGWKREALRAAVKNYRREVARTAAARLPAPPPEAIPETVRIEVADARALPLDDDTVDLIVTSPPYALEVAYEGGVDVAAEDWPVFMHDWLLEALRITKLSGRLAMNVPLDTRKGGNRPTYAEAVTAAVDAGWVYEATIVWSESNTTTGNRALGSVNSSARPCPVDSSELIALFSNGEWGPSSSNPDDIDPDDWQDWGRGPWSFSGESRSWEGHPASFPEELPSRCMQYLCRVGDLVCDPFSGSGSTAAAALRLERQFVGFDISEAYVRSAQRRVAR